MNKRRFKRFALFTGLVSLLIAGGFGLWLQSYQRQEALNRQLIVALVNYDDQEALVLVNEGADPNAPFKPRPAPSFRQLWDYLFHRSLPPSSDDTPTAFLIVCGAWWNDTQDSEERKDRPDAAFLVQTMLRHGANVNARSKDGDSALLLAVIYADEHRNPESIGIVAHLVAHGADPNLPDKHGQTALRYAQELRPDLVALLRKAGAKK